MAFQNFDWGTPNNFKRRSPSVARRMEIGSGGRCACLPRAPPRAVKGQERKYRAGPARELQLEVPVGPQLCSRASVEVRVPLDPREDCDDWAFQPNGNPPWPRRGKGLRRSRGDVNVKLNGRKLGYLWAIEKLTSTEELALCRR